MHQDGYNELDRRSRHEFADDVEARHTAAVEATYEDGTQVRRGWMMLVAGLGTLLAAIAAVLLMRRAQRRASPQARAERALVETASSLEQAARMVRKHGPMLIERAAGSVEVSARQVRKRGPQALRRSITQTEQAIAQGRKLSSSVANQASRAYQQTRSAGERVAASGQQLAERVQHFWQDHVAA